MKILIVSQHFWPENFRINQLVTALSAQGIEVEVLTGKPNYPNGVIYDGYKALFCARETWQGILIHRIPLVPRGRGVVNLLINYLSFILFGLLFGPWMVRGRKYDAIFVFGTSPIFQAIPSILLGWLKKCPIILWVQDLWPETLSATGYVTQPRILSFIGLFVKYIYSAMDLILVQSKNFLSKVRECAETKMVIYFPNFYFDNQESIYSKSPTPEGFNCHFPVLFAGNLGVGQFVDVIIDAAAILKEENEIQFIIVGDGVRRNWMMEEVSKRELRNIFFPGQFPIEVMPRLMKNAAALLVTLADKEAFNLTIPSKIQAYLASGRPIIGSLNGAGSDVIKEANAGIVVPAENALELANAVRSLANLSEEDRLKMGCNGRRYYEENFTIEVLAKDLLRHINQTIVLYQEKNS
jgi:glycosyltransferase involved in cell wall biosynthesis